MSSFHMNIVTANRGFLFYYFQCDYGNSMILSICFWLNKNALRVLHLKSLDPSSLTLTRAQIDFFHRFPQYRNSNHSQFQLTLSIAISSQVISFTIYPWYLKQGWKLAANPKEKTVLWYRILRNFNLCHRLKLWRSSRQIFFTFSFFYTSYWPSSRSVLQVTDRFCGTDWNHGEAVVKYFTFSFFYTYYWSSSRSVLQVTDRFLPCRCMAKGEVRGPY